MRKNNPFVTGTLILTLAGFLSRFIGFFYRAFLSRTFGEEGMGIYQLLAPAMALSFSLTAAGIQTAISKFTASETTTHDHRASFRVLCAGFLLSMPLSLGCTWFIYQYADRIATDFLLEARTAPLLRIFALSIPFCSVHSLINGYFYGIKRAGIPALTQILEQLARVGSVFLLCDYLRAHNQVPPIACAVIGLTIGECFSMLVSLAAVYLRAIRLCTIPARQTHAGNHTGIVAMTGKILTLSAPLTASRIAVNMLQSIEAVSIPTRLVIHGFSQAQALSVYGVLTGMALPLIMFPTALINSACVLLLPVISEADETNNQGAIRNVVRKAATYCSLFGIFCTVCFLLGGRFAGRMLFKSEMAGSFILTLSFICPLLYLSGAFSSVLHGLGKTGITFFFNITALAARLFFVFWLIPAIGIQGYLYGLLLSQFLMMLMEMGAVKYYVRKRG
ncbi:MAG: polysaccharide biosynthesis protein [Lachnospiraceae bacterium]|nr:polysaccharide biosynthesis protein [Lachnospiraceae bacterium]